MILNKSCCAVNAAGIHQVTITSAREAVGAAEGPSKAAQDIVRGHCESTAQLLSMWQDDMIGVVRFIDECLERILYTSDQPWDGWKR